MLHSYAELHCVTNFSFLRGASSPAELVERAHELGYAALAITDECSLAGVVRGHQQARQTGLPLIIGAEFALRDAWSEHCHRQARLVLLACNRDGYGNLSELITTARMRADKGSYRLLRDDLAGGIADCLALLVPDPAVTPEHLAAQARFFAERFAGRAWLAAELLAHGNDQALLDKLRGAARASGLPLVAAGDVHFHLRSRKSLQDTLTAIRLKRPVHELGFALAPNAEQHLRARIRLGQLYPAALLEETLEVASRCSFSLDELRYEYPKEIVEPGHTPKSWLSELTRQGAARRYPLGIPPEIEEKIEHELKLIEDLQYEPYFLTIAGIVKFARDRNILCQGRGSAANSVVCFCLGITEVDPKRVSLLFERFISRERSEPPDIDVDFEHQRREEVIQHIYEKYGRHRAALVATVICYRPRSAMRDVGRALGIDPQRIDQLARSQQWWDGRRMTAERMQAQGFDPQSVIVQHWITMTNTLMDFPRHLSQHVGGFVIARDKLTRLVPVENAAMPERSVIEWDKDDLDALGLLKVDVLALGMLSAIRRALDLITRRRAPVMASMPAARSAASSRSAADTARDTSDTSDTPDDAQDAEREPWRFRMQDIPDDDSDTYDMICAADTIGVFQIESRAQMSMLPRLRPRNYYDLVVEVAIVRPGPIQGGMVHPYLRRRQGQEPVEYPKEAIKPALERTWGVPIFQEQVMQIAILAAGFTPGEADQLRRAMAAWRRKGTLEQYEHKLVAGMLERGYRREFAESIFRQIQGFGEYGFPESHAASFALLVYVSSWIKRHEPAAFLAALLNSQPMGFYAPAQLVRDARAHGVEVRPVDVLISDYECTLEELPYEAAPADAGRPDHPRTAHTGIGHPDADLCADLVGPPEGAQGPAEFPGAPAAGQIRFTNCIDPRPQPAVRLGLNRVRGLNKDDAQRLLQARERRLQQRGADAFAFDNVEDLAREAQLDPGAMQALARAGALVQLAGHRANAHWEVTALQSMPRLLADARFDEDIVTLPAPDEGDDLVADYASIGIPMGRHPLALLRGRLARDGVQSAGVLRHLAHGRPARASGIVTHRQRPGTAKGVIFVTLEDETGVINVIVWPHVIERFRKELLASRLLTVHGTWQRDEEASGEVMHLVARRLVDHSHLLGELSTKSRDFR